MVTFETSYPRLWGYVRKILRVSPTAAVPTDKDGGFALVLKETLHEIKKETLSQHFYSRPINVESLAADVTQDYQDVYRCEPTLRGQQSSTCFNVGVPSRGQLSAGREGYLR